MLAIPSAIGISGDVAGAATALAGLVLVFLGAISNSFDSYNKAEQKTVAPRYSRRAWFAFGGFVLAVLSAMAALLAGWLMMEWAAIIGLALLLLSAVGVLIAAYLSVQEIK